MDLHQMENHENATTSMKVVLLLFAVAVIGALGYLVWLQNNSNDTSQEVTVKTQAAASTTSALTTDQILAKLRNGINSPTFGTDDNTNFISAVKSIFPNIKLVDATLFPTNISSKETEIGTQESFVRYDLGRQITAVDLAALKDALTNGTISSLTPETLAYKNIELNSDPDSQVMTFHSSGDGKASYILPIPAAGAQFINLTVK